MLPKDIFLNRWRYQFPEMSACPAPKSFKNTLELDKSHVLTIDKRFLDMNGHVNNCEYAGFVDKAMKATGTDKKPHAFQITYNSEARLGDVLNMKMGSSKDEFYIEADHARGTCFKAKVIFSEDIDDAQIFCV